MSSESTKETAPPGEAQFQDLEERVKRLEERLTGRSRVLELAVTVSCFVFSGLLIMHWAGHFFRHGN